MKSRAAPHPLQVRLFGPLGWVPRTRFLVRQGGLSAMRPISRASYGTPRRPMGSGIRELPVGPADYPPLSSSFIRPLWSSIYS